MGASSDVSKPVFIAVIVVVVLVVGAIGYHFLGPNHSMVSDSVKQKYADHFKNNPVVYGNSGGNTPRSGGGANVGNGGVYGQH